MPEGMHECFFSVRERCRLPAEQDSQFAGAPVDRSVQKSLVSVSVRSLTHLETAGTPTGLGAPSA